MRKFFQKALKKFDKLGIQMVLDTESVMISGQLYKIGFCGDVFVQRNGEWRRTSNVSASEVRNNIELDRLRVRAKRTEKGIELTPYMIKKIGREGKAERAVTKNDTGHF